MARRTKLFSRLIKQSFLCYRPFPRLSAENLQQAWRSAQASENEKLLQECSAFVVKNLCYLSETNFMTDLKEDDFKSVCAIHREEA